VGARTKKSDPRVGKMPRECGACGSAESKKAKKRSCCESGKGGKFKLGEGPVKEWAKEKGERGILFCGS